MSSWIIKSVLPLNLYPGSFVLLFSSLSLFANTSFTPLLVTWRMPKLLNLDIEDVIMNKDCTTAHKQQSKATSLTWWYCMHTMPYAIYSSHNNKKRDHMSMMNSNRVHSLCCEIIRPDINGTYTVVITLATHKTVRMNARGVCVRH